MSESTIESEVTKEVEVIKAEVAKLESELLASAETPAKDSATPEVDQTANVESESEPVAVETAAVQVNQWPVETTYHPEIHSTRQTLDFRIENSRIRNPG